MFGRSFPRPRDYGEVKFLGCLSTGMKRTGKEGVRPWTAHTLVGKPDKLYMSVQMCKQWLRRVNTGCASGVSSCDSMPGVVARLSYQCVGFRTDVGNVPLRACL